MYFSRCGMPPFSPRKRPHWLSQDRPLYIVPCQTEMLKPNWRRLSRKASWQRLSKPT